MISNSVIHQVLLSGTAIVAGILVLWSMVPEIITNFKDPAKARTLDVRRPIRQRVGNTMWVVHGLLSGNVQLLVVAGVGTSLALVLIYQILSERRSRPQTGAPRP